MDSPAAPRTDTRPIQGMLWMALAGVLFVGVTASVKMLDGRIPAAQSAFLRYLLGLVFLLPMLPALRAARLSRGEWRLFAIRGIVHALGVICWFYAMARITMAEVTAMNYLNPVLATVGAGLFLGEGMRARRLLAVLAGLTGALIILRPGMRALDPGHVAMLGTATLFAASYLIAKRLSGGIGPGVVVGLLSVFVTLGLAPFAALHWVAPGWHDLGLLMVTATFATAGHYAMTLAFRAAPMAVTQPVTFLQLLWAVGLGVIVFGEPIDPFVVTGGVLIVAAVSFIAWRESLARARAQKGI